MRQKLQTLWSNNYIQGSFFLTFASFLANFINYFFHFIAGRLLGPTGYGEITSLLSYISLLSVPIAIISTFLIQKISAKSHDQTGYVLQLEYKFWSLLKKYYLYIIPLLIFIPFLPRITNLSLVAAYSIFPLLLISLISSFYNSVFQGLKLFFLFSLLCILATFFKLLSLAPAFIIFQPVSLIILLHLSLSLLLLIFTIISFKRKVFLSKKTSQKFNYVSLETIITNQYFLTTLFSVFGISLLSNFDIIFVKKFFTSYDSGIYNSWNLFAKMILYVLGPITQVSFIFFSDPSQKHNQKNVLKISLILLGVIGITSYFFYIFAGSAIIQILFGKKFTSIFPFLGLSAIFGVGYSAITFINSYFLAKKSKVSLLLVALLPFYIFAFFLLPKSLITIMYINIIFCAILTILYSFFFFTHKSSLT